MLCVGGGSKGGGVRTCGRLSLVVPYSLLLIPRSLVFILHCRCASAACDRRLAVERWSLDHLCNRRRFERRGAW